LTSVEQSLVEHVGRGEWFDLAAEGEAIDAAAMRSWGKSRVCRASVLRDILRGRLAADPDPHGLRLLRARITGRLDLENLTTDVSLELADCLLEEGVVARDARLAGLGQYDRGLADRDRLGAAAAGVGVRGAVHRGLHQRRPQDMTYVGWSV
jgi:hypothetical protein